MASSSSQHHSADDVVPGEIVKSGCWETSIKGRNIYRFINCGDRAYIIGGVVFEGDDGITDTNTVTDPHAKKDDNYSFLYRRGRAGDFKYVLDQIPEGYYFIDLHFSEQKTKKRRFNAFIQGTMVLNEFSILDAAGDLHIPISLVDTRVRVMRDEFIRVQGTSSNRLDVGPLINGICIKKAATLQCPCCGTIMDTQLGKMRHEMEHAFKFGGDGHEGKCKEVKDEIRSCRVVECQAELLERLIAEHEKELGPEQNKYAGRVTALFDESHPN